MVNPEEKDVALVYHLEEGVKVTSGYNHLVRSMDNYWTVSATITLKEQTWNAYWYPESDILDPEQNYRDWFFESVKAGIAQDLVLAWSFITLPKNSNEPENNDGRTYCWWCQSRTKKVSAIFGSYDICTNEECGR